MAPVQPSREALDRRKRVGIGSETVTNITATDFPGHHPGEDNSWSVERFADNLRVQFHQNRPDEATFSLVGVDASVANAFRRILLAEVPTLAFETVYIRNNTSVIADEVLAHRLGLIPLTGQLDGLKWLRWVMPKEDNPSEDNLADYNTVSFELKVQCTRDPDAPRDATEPEEKYINSTVYSRHLTWIPHGRQAEMFAAEPIRPVSQDIIIAKLRPGQELDMELHARLGKGADHAKFSPVATATYRLLPTIDILRPVVGQDAIKFQRCFPPGVIDLERVTPADAASGVAEYKDQEGAEKAVVKDTMKDTVSREVLRHKEFEGKVKLGRVQDHFVFNVESTGQFPSDMLFLESVAILKFKAKRLLSALDEVENKGV